MTELNSILGNSVEKYQYLINNIVDVIAEIDLSGIFTYVSPQVHKNFGYKPEELIGAKFFNYIHPDDMPAIIDTFEKAIKFEDPVSLEYRVRHKEGHYIYVSTSGSLAKIDDNVKMIGVIKDITKRIEWEQELKEFESNFRNIADNSLMGITILQNNFVVYANNAVTEIIEYSIEEIREWSIQDFINLIDQEDLPLIQEKLKLRLEGPKDTMLRYSCRLHTKSGKLKWVEIFSKNISFNGNEAILSSMIDISEKKLVEIKLKESEVKFRRIFEAIPDIFFLVSNDGTYLDFYGNKKMLYAPPESFIGKKVRDIMPEDNSDMVMDAINKTIDNKQPQIREYNLTLPTNEILFFEARFLYFSHNQIAVFIRDITKRKLAEQIVQQSEKKYRDLYESSPSSIILISLDGTIIDCNIATVDLTGFEKQELIGQNLTNLHILKQDFLKTIMKKLSLLVSGEKTTHFEVELKKRNGDLIWIIFRASLIKVNKENYVQIIFYDITERKLLEKEFKEINQLKSELLERTSHELKTPLISIKGFTDLLLDLHKEKFDAETVSILDEVKQGTEQLEMIINKLLETSQLASGKLDFKPTQDDLSFLIKFCVKNLRGLANLRNHFISLDIPEKLILKFEKEKLYEVVSHLIINAIKYTPPYGEIKIQSEINDDYIIVSVKDNGIGLTEEEQKKIFKQFGKIERYGQGWDIGIEGTGMGLFNSKKIVELHGGKIWVESEGRNMGAKFCFSLPIIRNKLIS